MEFYRLDTVPNLVAGPLPTSLRQPDVEFEQLK